MAILRREIERKKKASKGRRNPFMVKKEGDIQVALLGYANSGKSTLVSYLTNAKPESSPIPFETKYPIPAMLIHGGVEIQLIDTPSLVEKFWDAEGAMAHLTTLIRNADALLVVVDASYQPLRQLNEIMTGLEQLRIKIVKPKAIVRIKRRGTGGISVKGVYKGDRQELENLLKSYGIHHAEIIIKGEADLDDVEEAIFGEIVYKPTIVVLTKLDKVRSKDEVVKFAEEIRKLKIKCIPFYPKADLNKIKDKILNFLLKELNLIRVYTKEKWSDKPSDRPLVIKRGSTVLDVAERIHSSLSKNFKYAKVWSTRFTFSPQKVGPDFVLEDGDIVEIVA